MKQRRGLAIKVLGIVLALGLIGCGSSSSIGPQTQEVQRAEPHTAITPKSKRDVAFGPKYSQPVEGDEEHKVDDDTMLGTGEFFSGLKGKPVAEVNDSTNGVTLNFVDADIKDVLKAVLTETLKVNYVLDPEVRGKVTLKSSTPIPKDAVMFAVEGALQLNNVALVEEDGLFQVMPMQKAHSKTTTIRPYIPPRGKSEGYSVRIVPLKYTTARAMEEVLRPLAPGNGILRVDHNRNLFLLAGTQPELDAMLDTIDIFDVDWLSSMSFAIIKPENVDAKTLTNELGFVFEDRDSPISGLVKLIPIPRINSILVMSKQPHYISQIQEWAVRLDRSADLQTRRIYIYRAQHSRAEDLSASLGSLLGASADSPITGLSFSQTNEVTGTVPDGTAGLPSPTSQPAPQKTSSAADVGGLRIVADEKNNALMILATPSEYELIESVLNQLDVAPDQVLIEASIAEVALNDDLAYGVQWFFQKSDSTFTLSDAASGAIASAFPGFSYTYLLDDTDIVLNALASVTDVKILSSPKLMVVNNQTASLQVGDQVPIATQSAVNVGDPDAPIVNNIEFRDTGVILEVTPRINRSGSVLLDVSQEVSDVADTVTSGIDSPTIQQRKITSTVVVQDGETVALGGLIRDTETVSNSGVPLLKDIPGIGEAFKSTDKSNRRTELLIFITPRIASNVEETRAITDYLRDRLESVDRLAREQ